MEEYNVIIIFEDNIPAKIENIPKCVYEFLKTLDKDIMISIVEWKSSRFFSRGEDYTKHGMVCQ